MTKRQLFWNAFFVVLVLMAWLLVIVALMGYGRGTELYIPLGQSPGVSGKLSVQGTLVAAHPAVYTVDVQTCHPAPIRITVSRHTAIYVDRSHKRQSNLIGTWRDLKPGRAVEVYSPHWIKVRP
jgi:hypothetical protein